MTVFCSERSKRVNLISIRLDSFERFRVRLEKCVLDLNEIAKKRSKYEEYIHEIGKHLPGVRK